MQIFIRNIFLLAALSFVSIAHSAEVENSPTATASSQDSSQLVGNPGSLPATDKVTEGQAPQQAPATEEKQPGNDELLNLIAQANQEQAMRQYEAACDELARTNFAQMDKIDWLLQECTNCIANNYAISTNKHIQLMKIESIKQVLDGLKNGPLVGVNLPLMCTFAYINQSILKHLVNGIHENFDTLDFFDPQTAIYIPDIKPEDVSYEYIMNVVQENEKLLQELENKINNIGLYRINRLYRQFKHHIWRPIQKYHILPIGGLIGMTVLGAGYLWWRLDNRAVEEINTPVIGGLLRKLRGILKYPGDIASHQLVNEDTLKGGQQNAAHNTHPIGLVGRTEHFLVQYNSRLLPIGEWIIAPILTVRALLSPVIQKKVTEMASKLDNRLMGGAYKNRRIGDIQTEILVNEEDVIGMEPVKQWADEVVDYFLHPDSYLRAKIPAPKGALFAGRTRSGKSTAINLIYTKLKKGFGKEVDDLKLWNVSHRYLLEHGFDALMALAQENAPVILAIEEIDFFDLLRPSPQLLHLLTAMSSCMQATPIDKAVIILATTNKPAQFDGALLTPGRFTDYFVFEYPNYQERMFFLKRELGKLGNPRAFDIEKIARETDDCSYENLDSIIKRALLRSKLYREPLTQAALEQSLDQHVRRILGEPLAVADGQRTIMATHLAGHVLASIVLEADAAVSKVTIRNIKAHIKEQPHKYQYDMDKEQPLIEHGRVFTHRKHPDSLAFNTDQEIVKQIVVLAAGQEAELLLLGTSSSYHMDNQNAITLAQSITLKDLNLDKLPKPVQQEYLDKAYRLFVDCQNQAKELLAAHKDALSNLAQELARKEILSASEVRDIIAGNAPMGDAKELYTNSGAKPVDVSA